MGNVMINVSSPHGGGSGGGNENFEGVMVTHKFSADELGLWSGYDGTGQPSGIWDRAGERLYI